MAEYKQYLYNKDRETQRGDLWRYANRTCNGKLFSPTDGEAVHITDHNCHARATAVMTYN